MCAGNIVSAASGGGLSNGLLVEVARIYLARPAGVSWTNAARDLAPIIQYTAL